MAFIKVIKSVRPDSSLYTWNNFQTDRNIIVQRLINTNGFQGDTGPIALWLTDFLGREDFTSCIEAVREAADHQVLGFLPEFGEKWDH